jgi:ribosomal-protein-alanine N-acetyltransferase
VNCGLADVPVRLDVPAKRHEAAFLRAVHASRGLHRAWVAPPSTPAQFRAYLERLREASRLGHLVCLPDGELAGVINISEIVRGGFRSAYLGYYAFVPHAHHGHMTAGLRLVISRAFRMYRLHRLEANIQPSNLPSIALVKRLGFRLEGFSPRYLRIAGRWRDHERWALTQEDWRSNVPKRGSAGRSRSGKS